MWEKALEVFFGQVFQHFGLTGLLGVALILSLPVVSGVALVQLIKFPRAVRDQAVTLAGPLQGLPDLLRQQHEDHHELTRVVQTIVDTNNSVVIEVRALSESLYHTSRSSQEQLLALTQRSLDQRDQAIAQVQQLLREFTARHQEPARDE